jgi:hypothetical protein
MDPNIEMHLYILHAVTSFGRGVATEEEVFRICEYRGIDRQTFKRSLNLLLKADYLDGLDETQDFFGSGVWFYTVKGKSLSDILDMDNEYSNDVFDLRLRIHQLMSRREPIGDVDRTPMRQFFLENLRKVPGEMLKRFEIDIREAEHNLDSKYV